MSFDVTTRTMLLHVIHAGSKKTQHMHRAKLTPCVPKWIFLPTMQPLLAHLLPISDRALKSSGFLGPQLPAKPSHPLLTSLLRPEKQTWFRKRRRGKSCREKEEDDGDYVKTGQQKVVREWMERKEEKLPSKNSEFMGAAGRDEVGEMREEIEGKKRGDQETGEGEAEKRSKEQ